MSVMETPSRRTAPFVSILDRLQLFHGISVTNDQPIINVALWAWDAIGNRELQYYRLVATITDYKVTLPCNVNHIEAVTVSDSESTITPESFLTTQILNTAESKNPALISDIYPAGKFLKFRHQGSYLEFDITDKDVEIIYSGIKCDELGLPFLNEKEIMAITTYLAYRHHYLRFSMGVVGNSQALMELLWQQWNQLCADARVPYHFTQNEMNRILDASFAWNWKHYGRSFKFPV